ncbi:hypothetical protein C2S52_019865 [Perilla frutescens var. hirtella]|nr:hypothetical protein C2S52_019865 [Perilla frutescens var. hirtella]
MSNALQVESPQSDKKRGRMEQNRGRCRCRTGGASRSATGALAPVVRPVCSDTETCFSLSRARPRASTQTFRHCASSSSYSRFSLYFSDPHNPFSSTTHLNLLSTSKSSPPTPQNPSHPQTHTLAMVNKEQWLEDGAKRRRLKARVESKPNFQPKTKNKPEAQHWPASLASHPSRRPSPRRREPLHHRRREPSYRLQISGRLCLLGFATTAKSELAPPSRNHEDKVTIKKMDEEPVMIHENSGDEREECIAENEQNVIVADNKLDIDILDNSGYENHEHNDENEQSITLIERVNTFDLSGSLIGFKRENFKEMYELYCLHAREIGFSVRKNTQRRNSTGAVIEKYYVCSSERVRNNTAIVPLSNQEKKWTRRRNITRTNCKAPLRVRRGQDGLLEVIEHVQEHNHELSRKEWSHIHRSQRSITDDKAVHIEDMISSGMRASDSYQYMEKEAGGEHLVGHTMKDHLNFVNRMKMSAIEVGDAQSFIDMLDSMMYEDYHLYGDVVVFDTTYRTNKYNMICAPFVGLNNHKKNVMFGCAFLTDEKIDTFEWLFEVFKKSMKLKCPITIFTDQDHAITNALSKVFPDARHQLCIWHLYQNAVSRFGRLKGNKDFTDAFQRCLTGCVNKEEFERCWASMISDHGLGDNSWFARLYDLREKWCIAYNKDYFSAGILSSQRSESTNHAIGFKASKATNLYEFYTIFKRTIQRWRSREQADEFECSKAIPNSCIPLTGMLKHASEVYTLSVFYDFEDELLKSISSAVNEVGEEFGVKVYDVQDHDDKIANSSDQIAGLMDFNGWRHNMARNYYSILIKAQESEEARIIIEEGSKSIFEAVEALATKPNLIEDTDISTSSISVLDPQRTTTKGRKRRIKGQLEKDKKKKTNNATSSTQLNEFGSKTPNPRLF